MQFMRLAGRASGASLGIDISTSSVTVIELAKFKNILSLQAYCRLPFPAESAFEEASEATSMRARVIADALRISAASSSCAVSALGRGCVAKHLDLPHELIGESLQAAMEIEAEKYFPFPIEEAMFDYRRSASIGSPTVPMLLVGCRKDTLSPVRTMFQTAGVRLLAVETEELAIERACRMLPQFANMSQRCHVVVNVCTRHFCLLLMLRGRVVYSQRCARRNVSSAEISRSVPVSKALISEILIEHSAADISTVLTVDSLAPCNGFDADLVASLSTALRFFHSTFGDLKVEKISVCGEVPWPANLAELIQSSVGVSVEFIKPLRDISLAGHLAIDHVDSDDSSLLIAIGLALRGDGVVGDINLLPWRESQCAQVSKSRWIYGGTGLVGALIILLLWSRLLLSQIDIQGVKNIELLRQRIILDETVSHADAGERSWRQNEALLPHDPRWLELLMGLALATPADVTVERLHSFNGELELSGVARSRRGVITLVSNLARTDGYMSVRLSSIKPAVKLGLGVTEFRLIGRFDDTACVNESNC
ncbi:MAG: pilus assembly protein PilM [Porticoccaceae bacterium]|nr:pilus assembly protein PilM [Porticoccaceae bacterium]